jgi:hypothetical protein
MSAMFLIALHQEISQPDQPRMPWITILQRPIFMLGNHGPVVQICILFPIDITVSPWIFLGVFLWITKAHMKWYLLCEMLLLVSFCNQAWLDYTKH